MYNINPHKGIGNAIPNEVFFEKQVDLRYVRTFGCIAHYKDYSQDKSKVEKNSKEGIFLGFSFKHDCYIIMDRHDFKLHLVREAIFEEDRPCNLSLSKNGFDSDFILPAVDQFSNDTDDRESIVNESTNKPINNKLLEKPVSRNHTSSNNNNINTQEINNEANTSSNTQIDRNTTKIDEVAMDVDNDNKKPNNISEPSYTMEDIIEYLNSFKISPENDYCFTPIIKEIENTKLKRRHSFDSVFFNKKKKLNNGLLRSIEKRKLEDNEDNKSIKKNRVNEIINNLPVKRPGSHIEYDNVKRSATFKYNGEIANISMDAPLTFYEAISGEHKDKWMEAINDELKNLYDNNIMTLVFELPSNKKPIRTKWVFTIKRDSNNNIIKFKARIVAKGYSQIRGIDYELTFSPTLSIDSIKLIISLAARFNWEIFQLDIKAAYLNAKLDKDIYVIIPQGDKNYGKGYWKLNKALYGLKQSGRRWNETITNFLINNGFQQLVSEPCIFKRSRKGMTTCIVGIYVDDMIITGKTQEIKNTISLIKNNFKISNCERINYLLGIKVEKKGKKYSISQTNYIENILTKFKVNNTRKAKTPCTGDNINENNNLFDKTTYKSALGSLIYLAKCSRPDICFAVSKASRNAEKPTISDWHKVINIFKYLNSTKNYKITYSGTGEFIAYTDADLGGDSKDKKSTSGHIILQQIGI